MADVHSKCATCRFFLNAEVMGSCRRYPHTINRHMNDWCGEHAFAVQMFEPRVSDLDPKAVEKAFDEEYAKYSVEKAQSSEMVYDIHTDTVKPKRKYTRKEKA